MTQEHHDYIWFKDYTFQSDKHLAKYLPIIRDAPVYPIIYDQQDRVLSFPPIINSEHSKITLNTRNVFIDVTATDDTKLQIVVNMVATMFSEYCEEPFTYVFGTSLYFQKCRHTSRVLSIATTCLERLRVYHRIEPCKIILPDGSARISPDIAPRTVIARASYINSCTSLSLSTTSIAQLLTRMSLVPSVSSDSDSIAVAVPCTRPDIFHEVDIMEDAAVAYGFNNLPDIFPQTSTVAQPLAISRLVDVIRREWAMAGWVEGLPLILVHDFTSLLWARRADHIDTDSAHMKKTLTS